MTIPRMNGLTAYWKNSPPVHLLVKYLFADEQRKEAVKPTQETLESLVNNLRSAYNG